MRVLITHSLGCSLLQMQTNLQVFLQNILYKIYFHRTPIYSMIRPGLADRITSKSLLYCQTKFMIK